MHQELPKHLSNHSEVEIVNHLSSGLHKIFQQYLNQSQTISRLQQENQSLKDKVSKLVEKNTSLEEERDKERELFFRERTSLLSELASNRRDKTATYIGGEDSELQHYLLYQKFQQLKEQDFNQVSNNIFRYLSDVDSSLKDNRKQKVAKIKSVLSQKVIINGIKVFNNDSSLLPKQSDTWSEEEYNQAIKDISQSIYSALRIAEEFLIPEAIRNETENLVRKGLDLVNKIASADPPGVFWVEKEGTLFNQDRHEAMLGCEESGIILFTVYPGYLVDSRVFDKAVVYTVPG